MDTPGGELPIEHRHALAIRLAKNAEINSPDLFLAALGYNPIARAAIADQGLGEIGETLLHAAAGAIGQLTCGGPGWVSAKECKGFILGWESIIQGLVAAGADLHATCSRHSLGNRLVKCAKADIQITPLMFMFASTYSQLPRFYGSRGNLNNALRIWISTLFDSGVNLKGYGERESLTWVNLEEFTDLEYTDYTTSSTRGYNSDYYFGRKRLLGFHYGPFPKDWKVWQNEPTDEFAGDFWLMLDRRVEDMPGTWVE